MKKISLGLALALMSTVAYAQTSQAPASSAGHSSSTVQSGSSDTAAPVLKPHAAGRTGAAQSRTETTGSTETRATGTQATESGTRTKMESSSRVGVNVGVSSRDEGVAIRHRSVREVDEPSVSVTRRRTVTSYDEPSTEVHRTVIKKSRPATKKVVIHKKKPTSKVVVRSRRHYVVTEPVEVRRRHVVRSYESDEPSVSVSRRTTIRQSRDVSPSVGVSVEQRRSSVRQSGEVGVSTTRMRSTSQPEATGSVSGRVQTNMSHSTDRGTAGGTTEGMSSGSNAGNAAPMRLQQRGTPSSGGSSD